MNLNYIIKSNMEKITQRTFYRKLIKLILNIKSQIKIFILLIILFLINLKFKYLF